MSAMFYVKVLYIEILHFKDELLTFSATQILSFVEKYHTFHRMNICYNKSHATLSRQLVDLHVFYAYIFSVMEKNKAHIFQNIPVFHGSEWAYNSKLQVKRYVSKRVLFSPFSKSSATNASIKYSETHLKRIWIDIL